LSSGDLLIAFLIYGSFILVSYLVVVVLFSEC